MAAPNLMGASNPPAPSAFTPLTPALSPLRGEGVAARARGFAGAPRGVSESRFRFGSLDAQRPLVIPNTPSLSPLSPQRGEGRGHFHGCPPSLSSITGLCNFLL